MTTYSAIPAWRRGLFGVLCFGVLLSLGCRGAEFSPVGVQGRVTLDGQPLPEGSLTFEPLAETAGQRREATIENGAFALPPEQGLQPGLEYQVLIKAFRKTGRTYPPGEMGITYEESVQYLPAQYNSATTLRVTIDPDPKKNDLQFDLDASES